MAEIIINQKKGRRNSNATRIDFTPMVDLGFILITFFIYTTTIAKPSSLEINMPAPEPSKETTVWPDESTITLLPAKDHKVYYYCGMLSDVAQLHMVSVKGLGELLADKKARVAALPASLSLQAHRLHVVIKPDASCKYEDVVTVFDDMNVFHVPYYTMVDIDPVEAGMIRGFQH